MKIGLTRHMSAVLSIWLLAIQSVYSHASDTDTTVFVHQYEVVSYSQQFHLPVEKLSFSAKSCPQNQLDAVLVDKSLAFTPIGSALRQLANTREHVNWRMQLYRQLTFPAPLHLCTRLNSFIGDPDSPRHFFS